MEWGSIVSWVGVAITAIGAAFGYGRLSQEVHNLKERLDKSEPTAAQIVKLTAELEAMSAAFNEFKNNFKAEIRDLWDAHKSTRTR